MPALVNIIAPAADPITFAALIAEGGSATCFSRSGL
jgi:hypothetical protein